MDLKNLIGRKINLVVRQPNGTNSVYRDAILLDADQHSIMIEYKNKKTRIEPRMYCAIEIIE